MFVIIMAFMVFSSLTFLFAYLPIVLLLYFIVPIRWRNFVLLLVSLFFYGWGEPIYVFVMVFSILVNWLFGNAIEKNLDTNHEKSKKYLILCMIFNIFLLSFFKYTDFFIENLRLLGLPLKPLGLKLPIGISFYTFQTMSYPIDLYRKQTSVQKDLISFGAYVCMFPQLIAGPIVRYTDIATQLNERSTTSTQFYQGITRFLVGLSKKVLLANNIGAVYESIIALPSFQQSTLTAWLGIICFGFQIYFDFSGYSDMAIGLGKMLGFDFLENFQYPYISKSITEFWRRWHMSLSYWFRDYVYIPLGGNRKGLPRQIINILIVWLLTGFWHGASWNFILWGLFYGLLLILEKLFLLRWLEKAPNWIGHFYTLVMVLIAWVLFAFTNLKEGIAYLKMMFGSTHVLWNSMSLFYLRNHIVLLIACVIACTPILTYIKPFFQKPAVSKLIPILSVLAFIACTAFIVDASYNPFLYFRF